MVTYRDADGATHAVESIDEVPVELRHTARELEGQVERVDGGGPSLPANAGPVHLPSFFGGVALAIAVVVALRFARGVWLRRAVIAAAALVAIGLLATAYLGALQHSAGLTEGGLATPREVIDSAEKAKGALEARQAEQQKQLDELTR